MSEQFCANDGCEAEAMYAVIRDDKETYPLPLCTTCMTAYEWGQASPDRPIWNIENVPKSAWRQRDLELYGEEWVSENEDDYLDDKDDNEEEDE